MKKAAWCAIAGAFSLATFLSAQVLAQTAAAPAVAQAWEHPSGPYKVVLEEDPSIADHTVYRPANLQRLRARLPIVAFAGPGCDFNGTAFRPFFTEVASHGYLVVVSGPPAPRGGSGADFPKTRATDLTSSLDWALAENSRRTSRFFGKLDSSKIAVMGQSCGGIQALAIANDPRISTLVLFNSGIFNSAPPAATAPSPIASAMPQLTKESLNLVRVPIAYFVGDTDIARANGEDDFRRLQSVPAFVGALKIPGDSHAGTFRQHNGGKFAKAAVAWLDWHLKGSAKAALMFRGQDCGLCRDDEWQVAGKNL